MRLLYAFILAASLLIGINSPGWSQSAAQLKNILEIRLKYHRSLSTPRVGANFGIPNGSTLPPLQGFISGSIAELTEGGSVDTPFDASASIGYGLRMPKNFPSLDIYLGITSVNPVGASGGFGFGEDGNLSVKSSVIKSNSYAIALGVNNLFAWGEAQKAPQNLYISASTVVRIRKFDLTYTLGYGSEQSRAGKPGQFVGVALKPMRFEATSFGLSYNANRWMFGFSSPTSFWGKSLTVSAGFDDVFDKLDSRRAILTIAKVF